MKLALVVLDMAGTTVADHGEVPASFAAALAGERIHVGPDALRALRGASKRHAARALVPEGPNHDEIAARLYADFVQRLTRAYAESLAPIDGAEAAFAALRARGLKLALNTGFDREITNLLITALSWADKVDAIVCGDDVAHGRPAPDLIFAAMKACGVADPAQVANIGDTALDLRAAAAAKVKISIGVLSGAHDRATLEREPHDALIASIADLPAILFARF
jgi:phosphonatase-like hydrolase